MFVYIIYIQYICVIIIVKITDMNLIKFSSQFPDENACIAHFKAQRDAIGVVCPKCGGKEHYWLKNKLRYECKQCRYRQSLRSGTVLENTKLPFMYWYIAMHLLTSTKKSFSAAELQRQLGHKRYQPIWELCKKLHDIMGKRDNKYKLGGQIELDNAFITTLIPEDQQDKPLKRGVGSQKQSKVVVMTESEVVENPKPGKKPRRVHHLKMIVIDDLRADTITEIVKEQVEAEAELTTDDSTSYKKLEQAVKKHEAQVVEPEDLPKILPWVHIAIGNVKRLLLDMHHQLTKEYLQYYLNEFCYKFNRRYCGEQIFDRLMVAAVSYNTDFKSKIYNRSLCG